MSTGTATGKTPSVPLRHSSAPPEPIPVGAGAASRVSAKAYAILGTEAMPPKLQQRLGSLDPEAAVLARQAERREQCEALSRVLKQLPTAEQLKIPANAEIPLAEKALHVLGSEELKEMSRNAVPNRGKIKNYAKLVAVLGEMDVTCDKAQQLLGSMDETQEAVRRADREMERQAGIEKKHQLQRVLSAPVTSQQLQLPAAARARALQEEVVSAKALLLMGEETLNRAVREHLPEGLKVGPKAMAMLGEAKALPAKARTVLGDLRRDTAARMQANEQFIHDKQSARDNTQKSDSSASSHNSTPENLDFESQVEEEEKASEVNIASGRSSEAEGNNSAKS